MQLAFPFSHQPKQKNAKKKFLTPNFKKGQLEYIWKKRSLLPRSKKVSTQTEFCIWMRREMVNDENETRIGDTKKWILMSEKVWCMYPWLLVHWIYLCSSVSLMLLVLRSVLIAENWRIGVKNRQCLCRILINTMEKEHVACASADLRSPSRFALCFSDEEWRRVSRWPQDAAPFSQDAAARSQDAAAIADGGAFLL